MKGRRRKQLTRRRAEGKLDLQRERFTLFQGTVLLAVLSRLRGRAAEKAVLIGLREVLIRRGRHEQAIRDVLRHMHDLAVGAALRVPVLRQQRKNPLR